MELMIKSSLAIFVFFFFVPARAQMHPTLLKVVSEHPSDYDQNLHLVTSDIEPISKETFEILFLKKPPVSVIQAYCKTEESGTVIRYYLPENFASLFGKPDSLNGIYGSFSYEKKIIDGPLEVTSFANYIENLEKGHSSSEQLIKNWQAIYLPKKKKCCSPMKLAAIGTTLAGLGILAVIFGNWKNIETCCAQ